jgi:hypothetical protein
VASETTRRNTVCSILWSSPLTIMTTLVLRSLPTPGSGHAHYSNLARQRRAVWHLGADPRAHLPSLAVLNLDLSYLISRADSIPIHGYHQSPVAGDSPWGEGAEEPASECPSPSQLPQHGGTRVYCGPHTGCTCIQVGEDGPGGGGAQRRRQRAAPRGRAPRRVWQPVGPCTIWMA